MNTSRYHLLCVYAHRVHIAHHVHIRLTFVGHKGVLVIVWQKATLTDARLHSLSSILTASAWSRLNDELNLSPRELQIVQRVLLDEKETEIARQLAMSPHTVHTHLERLYIKLSVQSRLELIVAILTTYIEMSDHSRDSLSVRCPGRISARCPLSN